MQYSSRSIGVSNRGGGEDSVQDEEFTVKEFDMVFRTLEILKQQVMDVDPNIVRSMQIRRDRESFRKIRKNI